MQEKITETDNEVKKDKISLLRKSALVFYILFFIGAAAFEAYMIILSILPLNYTLILGAALLLLAALIFLLLVRKRPENKETHRKAKDIATLVISVILIALLAFVAWYIVIFENSINKVNEKTSRVTLSVRVLKDSGYSSIKQLNDVAIGANEGIDINNTEYVISQLKETLGDSLNVKAFGDYKAQIDALYSGEVAAVLMNEAIVPTINDLYEGFEENTEVIYTVQHEITEEQISEKDLTKQPFNVYLSGGDNYGAIEESGRSDVNIIANVNPVTKKVVLINVPRDYYVALDGDADKMDKLTHAGVYGPECSMNTISSLLNTPIQYYVKVNFSSVAQIIDALGGITVYCSQEMFLWTEEKLAFTYHEGYNEMSGPMAVRFCRERALMEQGDIDRGRNQENVIKAIIDKATSPAIITNFSSVLDAITNNCITNVSTDSIMSLIQMQLSDMSGWDISMYTLSGYDSSNTTYTGGSEELYVMQPDENTVEEAKNLLRNNMLLPDDKALLLPDTETLVQNQKKDK